jgi:hypothetical protein
LGSSDKVGSIVCKDDLTNNRAYDGKIIWVRLTATFNGYALAEYD